MGYHQAGFEVVGLDIALQPHYPFEFIRGDALTYEIDWSEFDAVHASPPCEPFTIYRNVAKNLDEKYENLLDAARELVRSSGLPYVIENVERAPMIDPVMLCGSMFDGNGTNDIRRHRLFETNWGLRRPGPCNHKIWEPDRYPGARSVQRGGHYLAPVRATIEIGSWDIPIETQKWAMGIDWEVNFREISEAIPPAYTKYVGEKLMHHIQKPSA